MTTIAADGITVAADGLRCAGHEPIQFDTVKIKIVGGVLYGFTGLYRCFDPAIEWWSSDDRDPAKLPKSMDNETWTLLVFSADGARTINDKSPYPEWYPYPLAFGSGADFATAAMACGKTPREAVEIAALKNVYTGGVIREIPIPQIDAHPERIAAE